MGIESEDDREDYTSFIIVLRNVTTKALSFPHLGCPLIVSLYVGIYACIYIYVCTFIILLTIWPMLYFP